MIKTHLCHYLSPRSTKFLLPLSPTKQYKAVSDTYLLYVYWLGSHLVALNKATDFCLAFPSVRNLFKSLSSIQPPISMELLEVVIENLLLIVIWLKMPKNMDMKRQCDIYIYLKIYTTYTTRILKINNIDINSLYVQLEIYIRINK